MVFNNLYGVPGATEVCKYSSFCHLLSMRKASSKRVHFVAGEAEETPPQKVPKTSKKVLWLACVLLYSLHVCALWPE